MSWKAYNDIIDAIRYQEGLTLDEARERYNELQEEGLSVDDLRDAYNVEPAYDDLDAWIDDYESGDFDDYPYDEIDGGFDYEDAGA